MCILQAKPIASWVFLGMSVSILSASLLGQDPSSHKPDHGKDALPSKIMVDAEILSAFVDKPCEEFCSARDQFLAGDHPKAAGHLRTASAFLQLEAARADANGRPAIENSIRELRQLAGALEKGQVRSFSVLKQTFVRAHVALAGHHFVVSSLRCCQLEKTHSHVDATATGRELHAASTHFGHAAMWRGQELDEESRRALEASRRAAEQLIASGDLAPLEGKNRNRVLSDMQDGIGRLHRTLEKFTGRKIQLARPHEIDPFAPTDLR